MTDETEIWKNGRNADDTMRITRLDGTPLIVDPEARSAVSRPPLVEGQTRVSALLLVLSTE